MREAPEMQSWETVQVSLNWLLLLPPFKKHPRASTPHLLESGCWRQYLLCTTITAFKRKCSPHFLLSYFRGSLWLIFYKVSPEEARPRAWVSWSIEKDLLGTEKKQTLSKNCQFYMSAHGQVPSRPQASGVPLSWSFGAAQGPAFT